jgi:nitrile hydratase beta subunit
MNGVHDMGGLQGFGPVVIEKNEPLFHAAWERRALGLTLAMGATGLWNLDQSRAARESLAPAKYLSSSYYRIWIEALGDLMVARDAVTPAELADGRTRQAPVALPRVLTLDRVPAVLARGSPTERTPAAAARFKVGDAVHTRNLHPATHTRLPRYCRDKPGTVVKVHGVHVFADANGAGRGEQPQWLYGVRFAAADLFGADTTAAAVHVDLWEPHLAAAGKDA